MPRNAFVAIVTCFNEDKTVNYAATRTQVRRQVESGNNFMCAGTSGDFKALIFDEKVRLTKEPDHLVLWALQNGATGCISGLGNAIPSVLANILNAFNEGNIAGAQKHQETLTAFRSALYALGFAPARVKRALYLQDEAVGMSVSRPFYQATSRMPKLSRSYGGTISEGHR